VISNIANGGTMVLTGAGTAYTISNSAFTSGTNDTINLALTDGSSAGVSFAATGITASGVENLVITVADTEATPTGTFNDSVTLLGNYAKTVTISGNAGLTLTQTDTQLTSLDASAIALGGFTFTSGALAAAATIAGSATGTNIVDFSAATAAVTYQGGAGADAITGTNGRNNIVALGGGTNSYTGGSGNQTVTAGTGADAVVLGNGTNNVSLGNGANSFTAGSGSNTYVGGTGADVVSLGGGSNIVTLGVGANIFNLTAVNTNLNTYTTILDPTAGDTVTFLDQGTETFNATKMTLANTAVFQDYADAVVQAGGNASVNGAFGWFQYGGDTYLVESRHDGSGVSASFSNGVDAIVKLSGLVDLSTAGFSHTNSLILA
jgi:S-layer protein